MEYIQRSMEPTFLKLNEQHPAILITGPRQVGKTTMLQKLMELEGRGRKYVFLEDINERALAKFDPAMFFQLHEPPVFCWAYLEWERCRGRGTDHPPFSLDFHTACTCFLQ